MLLKIWTMRPGKEFWMRSAEKGGYHSCPFPLSRSHISPRCLRQSLGLSGQPLLEKRFSALDRKDDVIMDLPCTVVPFSNSAFIVHPCSITRRPCSKLQGTLKLDQEGAALSYSMNASSVRCAEALTSFSPATTSRHRRPSRPPTLPAHALRNRRRSHLSWNEYAVRVQKPLHVLHEVEGHGVRRLVEELLAFETDPIFSRDSNPCFQGKSHSRAAQATTYRA